MKIVYMGTPDFAVPALEKLNREGYDILAVITQPDRQKDRGKKVLPSPVKAKALELGLKVFQPNRIKDDPEFIKKLEEMAPDFIVVVAFGQILPVRVLKIPKYGCINIHGSLLPKYRGAAPIQRAILDGEKQTGVTIMYMEEGLDTGDMISSYITPILKKTGQLLQDELAGEGAKLLIETLKDIASGTAKGQKQDESKATYASKIQKKEGKIDFTKSASEIERMIRAFNPRPSAFTSYDGNLMKILEAEEVTPNEIEPFVMKVWESLGPGAIFEIRKDDILVVTGTGILAIKSLQPAGKKPMSVTEYLKGSKMEVGNVLF